MATGGAVAFLCAAAVAIPSASLAADVAPSAAPADAAATPVPPATGPDDKGNPAPPEPRSWDETKSKPDNAERMSWTVRRDQDIEWVLSEVKILMADGKWTESAVLLQRALDHAVPAVVGVGSNRVVSPRLAAEDILSKFSPEALSAYRTLADPSARSLLPQGRNSDEDALRTVARRFFYSSLGDDAAFGYASRALSRGRHSVAQEWFEKVLTRHPDPDVPRWELLSKLFLAASGGGDFAAALRYGEACLKRETDLPAILRQGIEAELTAIRKGEAVAAVKPPECAHTQFVPTLPSVGGATGGAPRDVWFPAWTAVTELAGCPTQIVVRPGHVVDAGHVTRILEQALLDHRWRYAGSNYRSFANLCGVPGPRGLVSGSNVFVRAFGNLIAVDTVTGRERWRAPEPEPDADQPASVHLTSDGHATPFCRPVDYTLSAADGRIYCLERAAQVRSSGTIGRKVVGKEVRPVAIAPGSAVAARDAETGRLLWRSGWTLDTADPFYAMRFLCAPLTVENRLFTVCARLGVFTVVELSPADGSLAAQYPLPFVLSASGSEADFPAALCEDGDRLILLAQELGVVTAVSWDNGEVLWTARYRRLTDKKAPGAPAPAGTAAAPQGQVVERLDYFNDPNCPTRPWAEDRLWIGGGLLLACPRDATALVIVDSRDGTVLRETDLLDPVSLIGVADGRAYVACRTRVTAVELATGRTLWATPVVGTPAGGVAVGGRLYVPCVDHIVEIDAATGRAARPLLPAGDAGPEIGNLTLAGSRLYSVQPLNIRAFDNLVAGQAPSGGGEGACGATVAALDRARERLAPTDARRARLDAALFDALCEAVETDWDEPGAEARLNGLATTPEQRARAACALARRIARVSPPGEAAAQVARLAVDANTAILPLEGGRRRTQARLAMSDAFRSAAARAGATELRPAETLCAQRIEALAAAGAPAAAYRTLSEALPGTDGAVAAAARAATAWREGGEYALGEAVLLNALNQTTPDRAEQVLRVLSEYYRAGGWEEAAGNAAAAAEELKDTARRHPGATVPAMLQLREQAAGTRRRAPALPLRERGALPDSNVRTKSTLGPNYPEFDDHPALLLKFDNPWKSPFLETHAVYMDYRGSNIVCVSLATLQPVWRMEPTLGSFGAGTGRQTETGEIPVPTYGHLALLHEGRNIVAVDLLKGRRVWSVPFDAGAAGVSEGAGPATESPVLGIMGGCAVIYSSGVLGREGVFRALDMTDGSLLWESTAHSPARAVRAYDCGDRLLCVFGENPPKTLFLDLRSGRSRLGPTTKAAGACHPTLADLRRRAGPWHCFAIYRKIPLYAPDGVLLPYSEYFMPWSTGFVEESVEFIPSGKTGSHWMEVVGIRAAEYLPLGEGAFFVRTEPFVQLRSFADGRILWHWQYDAAWQADDRQMAPPRGGVGSFIPDDGKSGFSLAFVGTQDAPGATLIFKIATRDGSAEQVGKIAFDDPRIARRDLVLGSLGSRHVWIRELLDSKGQPSEYVWNIKAFSLPDGAPLKDVFADAEGLLCSSLKMRTSAPRLVARGDRLLLLTDAGIRVFESQGERR